MIEFTVEGRPVGKQRPRLTSYNGETFVYTPKKTEDYEQLIALMALRARNAVQIFAPLADKVRVSMKWFSGPKGKQPDIDNVIKSVLDGMNGVIYIDDRQVSAIDCTKYITKFNEHLWVKITKYLEGKC